MIRRPPRSTLDRSSAASDVYKRQKQESQTRYEAATAPKSTYTSKGSDGKTVQQSIKPVSYTHLRAHETVLDIVCRLLLEKKKKQTSASASRCALVQLAIR